MATGKLLRKFREIEGNFTMNAIKSDTEIQQEIKNEVMKWYKIGREKFPQENKPIEIKFDLVGQVAGQAFWGIKSDIFKLRFNMQLARENYDEFLSQTVPHEVAHLIADEFFKEMWTSGCDHNSLWQFVMVKFGKSPTRCHDYSVENISRKKYKGEIEG